MPRTPAHAPAQRGDAPCQGPMGDPSNDVAGGLGPFGPFSDMLVNRRGSALSGVVPRDMGAKMRSRKGVIALSLREALEHALAGTLDDEAREHIKRLLAQRVKKYETLVDECEVVIYG